MNSHRLPALVLAIAVVSSATAHAATVVEPIDFFIIGDDETVTVLLDNDFLPDAPMELWFEGFAENLDDQPTNGVDIDLRAGGSRVTDRVRLELPPVDPITGAVQVPISLHAMLANSPSPIGLRAEGLGCCDNIHVSGTLTRTGIVPEPATLMIAGCGLAMLVPLHRRQQNGRYVAR